MTYTKLDETLISRVHTLRQAALRQVEDDDARLDRTERVKVLLHYTGDLGVVEEAGFWTEFRTARIAAGTIAAEDLERISALDNVVTVHGSRPTRPGGPAAPPPEPPDVDAANPDPAGLDATTVRDEGGGPGAPFAADVPTVPSGFTGRGVVVGVIDSGIDIFHPAFRKLDGSTRIVSLLDLTLRQTITATGSPTGGSMRLRWQPPGLSDQATGALSLPLTAADAQTALSALGGVSAGDVVVTGGPLPAQPLVIDFEGQFIRAPFDTGRINPIRLTDVTLTGGTRPTVTVTRGRVITPAEINVALAAAPPPPTPPQAFLSRDPEGHGSHVAGIAAGLGLPGCCSPDRVTGIAHEADLAIVRTTFDSIADLQAAHYILEQQWVPAGSPKPPVVVNISIFGTSTAHDGTSPEEQGLDDLLIGATRRSIVLIAGNTGGRARPNQFAQFSEGQHASGAVPANGSVTVGLDILSGDTAADILALWYPGPGRLNFTVTAPQPVGGPAMAPVVPNPDPVSPSVRRTVGQGPTQHVLFVASHLGVEPNRKNRIIAQISPAPAVAPLPSQIAPGVWTITLTETQGTATPFDCWTDPSLREQPARFVPADQDPTRTVASPGTARLPLTVGAYNPANDRLADFSGRGPTADFRLKPEVCAPGVGIVSAKAGGIHPDLLVAGSGTSQAAPYVTGVIALMFQANNNLDHTTIVGHLTSTCLPPVPPVPPTQLDSGWGFGRVNPERAVLAAMPAPLAESFAAAGEPLILPAAAYPAVHIPPNVRMRQVLDRLAGSTTGRRAAEFCAAHLDEARHLVDTERRVTVAWHRMHGPLLLRRLLLSELAHDEPVPRTLGGRPVADGLARLLDELAAAGSPALREAVATHRDFLLRLPGARLSDLDDLHDPDDLDDLHDLDDRTELS
ncbi:S8 family serine peptidase [Kitasatospora purpeofusca]|uniref:S8 family serine peptidase n=1 Tax=Kitasatospora purpeofusca TaxID=67352 RepID=UPI00364AF658